MSGLSFRRRARCDSGCRSVLFAAVALCALALAPPGWAGEGVAASLQKAPATHKQKKVVKVASAKEGSKLEDFCISTDGRIFALLGPGGGDEQEDGASLLDEAVRLLQGSQSEKPPVFASAVHVYDADGTLVEKWPVGFLGQAINTAPDGTIVIGGDGRIGRFDLSGKKLLEAESPQMTYIAKNPDEMRERAKEQLESDRATYTEQVKQFEDQLKELTDAKKDKKDGEKDEADKNDPPTEEGVVRFNERNLKQIIEIYKRQLKSLESRTVDDVLKQVLARARKIHAISGSDDEIFVTCPAMAGYGYGVWRTDKEFGNAREIVKSLSGCCGQMDVQCCDGELYVCENSRHRVVKFDRDGKELAHFGKRDREGNGENFGGCCNPMNLCFSKDGNLYVSESNGVVKNFTPGGEFLGIVGVADVEPGCKNSCVGVTADDSRLFYIDIYKSQIIVLARAESEEPKVDGVPTATP